MPITNFLSCTHVFDEFESLSPAQRRHAKSYATGLVAASNKTVAGIAREVLPAQGKRALNKFLTEYNWDEQQFNHERLEELQKHGETRWSTDGYIILDDTITEKAGDEVPGVGHFYDHAEGDTVWGQDLIYAFYADDKTAYPLTFRLYEQQADEDDNHDTKYERVTGNWRPCIVNQWVYCGNSSADSLQSTLYDGDGKFDCQALARLRRPNAFLVP